MTLLISLRTYFKNEEDGPLLNELLNVLHFMGVDEATKAAFCEQVVKAQGRRFMVKYVEISRQHFSDSEEKFVTLAAFLEKTAPKILSLVSIA